MRIQENKKTNKSNGISPKCKAIFEEINSLAPNLDLMKIRENNGGRFAFWISINDRMRNTKIEMLELSQRSSNCLHRAGYETIGELVENINSRDDLKKIRNCGEKSVNEIMEQLFCYQYSQLGPERKMWYIGKLVEMNKVG